MPRLSLDTVLDRLLAESVETTRFTDYSAVVRRLHLGQQNVPVGTRLHDSLGQEWLVGDRDEIDNTLPVATTTAGASRKVAAGELLRDEVGNAYALCADVLLHVGGVWDKQRREFRRELDGSRDRGRGAMIVDAQESQVSAFRWLAGRLAAFREGKPHPQVAGLCYDDRRGGKTFYIVVGVILSCLECPTVAESPLEARIVTQTVQSRDEIDEIFKLYLPPGWGHLREQPKRQYTFATGAKVGFLTTDNVDTLLAGRMDIVAINEAALFPRKVYEKTVRATQDRRGFVLLATNTPENPRGNWTALLIEGLEKDSADGVTPAVARLRVASAKNAAISADAKGPIVRSILYARGDDESIVDDGIVKEAGAKLFAPPYDSRHHVPIPQLGLTDITSAFTERVMGRPYDYICGQDYQWDCTASAWRLMAPGGDWSRMQLWCVWAEWLDGRVATSGDRSLPEDDLLDACEAAGYTTDNTLIIPDCSAGSQGSRHKHGIEPPTVEILNRRRWAFDYPSEKRNVDSMHPRNPLEGASNMSCRKWLKEDRIFVAATDEAYKMHKALTKCDAVIDPKGNLRAKSSWAHLIDTMRYVQWWAQRRFGENPTAVATPQRTVIGRKR